ncbi:hypothetical protein Pcinc_033461 [Petrolisthes cinctipes]|uniref:Uncharacterized protein n=1 Tax=Petrolisthes cinctipes TaxID=88211 RepID=A0AAE1ES97_PETCI|nr:hypothetical protein Pcinc_033461 [Petrolisthes cinctipes]
MDMEEKEVVEEEVRLEGREEEVEMEETVGDGEDGNEGGGGRNEVGRERESGVGRDRRYSSMTEFSRCLIPPSVVVDRRWSFSTETAMMKVRQAVLR